MNALKVAHVPSLVPTRWVSPGWQSLWQLSGMLHSGLPAWPTLQEERQQQQHIWLGQIEHFRLQHTQTALSITLPEAQRAARLTSSLLTYRSFRERPSGQFFKQTGPLALISWSGGGEWYWFLQPRCSYVKCTDRRTENAATAGRVTTLSGTDQHSERTHTVQHWNKEEEIERGEEDHRGAVLLELVWTLC